MTLLDVWIDDRLDQTSELFFKYPANDPKASLLGVDQDVSYDSREWFVDEKNDERNGSEITTVVRCVASWYRLGERIRIGSTVIEARTCAQGLEAILADSGWTVGERTAAGGSSFSYEDQDQTVLALVRGWATICDKVVVFDTVNRTVDLIDEADRGFSNGMAFRYGRNVTSIKRRVKAPDVTRLYPFGRDDLDITGVSPDGTSYIEDYGFYTAQGMTEADALSRYRKDEVWSNTDIVDEDALLAAGQARLAERSSALVEYQMSVVDLTELIGVNQTVGLGDNVRVSDTELGFDVSTTVVRYVRYPLQPHRDKIELAYLYDPADSAGSRNSRSKSGLTWELFQSRSARYVMRDDRSWVLNRIALAFSEAAEAVYGYDVTFTGVNTGTFSVSAYDAETGELEHAVEQVPYTDGEVKHITWSWSHDSSDSNDELNGQKDYRIRAVATTSGGGGASAEGVDIEQFDSRFWILARGAVKRTPDSTNTVRYDYTGAAQEFVVPDGVSEIEVTAVGANSAYYPSGNSAQGGTVVGIIPVIAGSVLKVIVGGKGTGASSAVQTGSPSMRGGSGDGVTGFAAWAGGGGTGIFPDGATVTTEGLLIAAGAGGNGQVFAPGSYQVGGFGGFFAGQNPEEITQTPTTTYPAGRFPGNPANQFQGGAAGNYDIGLGIASLPGAAGQTGGSGAGGVGGNAGNSFTFPPGGGGGGYNGGGGAGTNDTNGNGQGGGGGGACGYADAEVTVLEITDGFNTDVDANGDGYLIIKWDDPLA